MQAQAWAMAPQCYTGSDSGTGGVAMGARDDPPPPPPPSATGYSNSSTCRPPPVPLRYCTCRTRGEAAARKQPSRGSRPSVRCRRKALSRRQATLAPAFSLPFSSNAIALRNMAAIHTTDNKSKFASAAKPRQAPRRFAPASPRDCLSAHSRRERDAVKEHDDAATPHQQRQHHLHPRVHR